MVATGAVEPLKRRSRPVKRPLSTTRDSVKQFFRGVRSFFPAAPFPGDPACPAATGSGATHSALPQARRFSRPEPGSRLRRRARMPLP